MSKQYEKAIDLLEMWVYTFESDIEQEGDEKELQELKEVKEALVHLYGEHGVFMIQKFYGADDGWQNVRDDGRLFDSKQEALETWFEDDIIEKNLSNADLTDIPLPKDIRIVEIKF